LNASEKSLHDMNLLKNETLKVEVIDYTTYYTVWGWTMPQTTRMHNANPKIVYNKLKLYNHIIIVAHKFKNPTVR
jgi:hypothetical protein